MKFLIYRDSRGEYRWRLQAKNGRIVADSGEGYGTRAACQRAVSRVRAQAATAELVVLS